MIPQWSEAIAVGNAVEVPIMIDGNFNVPSLHNDLTHLGKQRLVIYDKGGKGKVAYVFDYMPSDAFSSKIDEVNAVNIRDKKFDGKLAVHTLSDKKIARFVWEKGEVHQRIGARTGNATSTDCSISVYVYGCGRIIIGGNVGSLECSVRYTISCWIDNQMQDDWCIETDPDCINGSGGDGDGGTDYTAVDYITLVNLNPCNTQIWNKLATTTSLGDINQFIRTFNSDASHNISVRQERFGNTIVDGTAVYDASTNTYEITLNTDIMENASQEYIAVTLMHEVLHAYLGAYFGIDRSNDVQHPLMVENYCVDFMANALRSMFPNMSMDDALALSWQGLDNTPSYNAKSLAERFRLQTINDNYKSHVNGTICP